MKSVTERSAVYVDFERRCIAIEKTSEIRDNAIWDDGDYYVLEHIPTHKVCAFERSEKALSAVQKAICRDGTFCPTDRKSFRVQPWKSDSYYISQLLYSVYNDKPMSWVRNGRVNFNDDNCHNLIPQNLSHTHEYEPNTFNRRIWKDGKQIFLYHKKSGETYFCDNEDELYDLLIHHRVLWGFQPVMRRLQATVLRKKRKIIDFTPHLHVIVYAYHHYGARRNNFIGAIRQMQRDFAKSNLTIDHLDSSQLNDMRWNLSPMTVKENAAKKNLTAMIKAPFFFYAVYTGSCYKIAAGRVYSDNNNTLLEPQFDLGLFLCNTARDLIGLIKVFLDTKWPDGLSPRENHKSKPDRICLHSYFGDYGASEIRTELLNKSETEFEVFYCDIQNDTEV